MGLNEDEAKAKGLEYKTGKFSFMANSRARAVGDTDGMVRRGGVRGGGTCGWGRKDGGGPGFGGEGKGQQKAGQELSGRGR